MNLCEECGCNAVMPDMILAVNRATGERVIFCSDVCADTFKAKVA